VIEYLILFLVVLGVNLLPAFGPPTWSIIVLYSLNAHMSLPLMVVTGALAAALGRFALGSLSRLFADKLSHKTRANLNAARELLEKRKRNAFLALGLFALSPVPSAQLFEAAGLTGVSLVRFTIAFFFGRIISYSIYGFTAEKMKQSSLGDTFRDSLTSPLGIALQLLMLALLVLLAKVDWAKILSK
jgi:uncharacterized membrane protein YdjX (TVP38/TMEM64 family)